ncbi:MULTISPECIES: glycosyltransferase family 4 protein [Aeribacillus]|uniref:Glycosyl transferase n=1 Tax=Aeribacillus pallidus TaxID=33936 RepID=A0A165Z9V7_9BACI|nr:MULTISPECIES: glycosyltransferase family 4 protein [Aeribacillus]KZN98026.1 hypothetical protein AZI98_00345 [Aeribacillus pallidus]MED0715182.1 glycosyltransferase family 4 protein [Aeribacillus composti]MED0746641.1 glycosyltransferase family 4 protein [Aeribacillus composti]MED1442618.1 glycosyltransferase family 4 protein [Aeribacillus composti]
MTKVCVLTTVHHAYDGRIYHKQCKTLQKAGYEVTLIAPKPEKIIEHDNIQLIPIDKPKKEWKRFLHTFSIIKKAIKTNADVYHFHDPELLPVGVLLRLITRKIVIFDVHEHYPNAIMSKKYLKKWVKIPVRIAYEIIEKISLQFISGVIYTTDEVGERYKKYKSCKIENYPLLEMFEQLSINQKDPKLILYLGGITPIRGIRELIEAFKIVSEKMDAKLLFVGGFEAESFEKEIKDKIRQYGLESQIQFAGKVSYEQIQTYLEKASIGIIPYLPVPNHLVCLPNKIFEYLAGGVIPIASNFPHYDRVLKKAGSGRAVDPENPKEIADAILFFLQCGQDQLNQMRERGRNEFLKSFNWKSEGNKLLDFYQSFQK